MKLEEVKAIFIVAGVEATNFYPIATEYRDSAHGTDPWWLVQTEVGMIKIGWRRRVINIDWSMTGFVWDLKTVEDEVTKEPTYIHAYSQVKAAEYLGKLAGAVRHHQINFITDTHTRVIQLRQEVPGFILNRALGSEAFYDLVKVEMDKHEEAAKRPVRTDGAGLDLDAALAQKVI